MAIKQITVYECDICKSKVNDGYYLTQIRIPSFENGDHYFMEDCGDDDQKESIIDCCPGCTEKIAKLLAKNVGYYDIDEDKVIIK